MTDLDQLARGLSEAQRTTVLAMSLAWQAGPFMDESMHPELRPLRDVGVVERHFGDMSDPAISASDAGITVNLSACWWFRLTELGAKLRAHLRSQGGA